MTHQRIRRLLTEQSEGINQTFRQLENHQLHILPPEHWTNPQKKYLKNYFLTEVLPILTPITISSAQDIPLLPGQQINIILTVSETPETEQATVIVPVPRETSRFITIPSEEGLLLARLEDTILQNAEILYSGKTISDRGAFRIVRDADVAVADDESDDLLSAIEKAIIDRRLRQVVQITIMAHPRSPLRNLLKDWFNLQDYEIYDCQSLLDPAALMSIGLRGGFEHLHDPHWIPQVPLDLLDSDDIWQSVRNQDILLFHPYDSFDPVVQLVQQAAQDPNVLAIKQTLYRTSGNSPIVQALELAAMNGKQVTVLVELKARFDEARNIIWARRLENAGCLVIYGVAGLKTHSKALLIIRREANGIQRYAHLATGNYNDKTAKLYTDLGLITFDRDLTADVSAFFNILTGYSEIIGWNSLTIAPTDMRRRFLELIDREIQTHAEDNPGLIIAKCNSLQDPEIIKALYRASCAGVRIQLNVRGICCLRPGIKKLSENIAVTSIIDRYLEHARIYYFRNGGHEEYYLSSADWMTRNLDKRMELLFPIRKDHLKKRISRILSIYFQDNTKAFTMMPDGTFLKKGSHNPPCRAQELFYTNAVETARKMPGKTESFRPIKNPDA